MSSVDSRIVTMKFDNNAFLRGVSTTMDALSKLTSGLGKLPGSAKGLTDINSAANKVDISHVGTQADGIASKFSAMSVVAVTALATLVHSAVQAGISLGNSLTVAPITSGLKEYETNLNSIQTIMANTGLKGEEGLGKVNHALEVLNEYSDKTIYNFSEMARNIGTFTAAGIDLDTSTAAIKGIANLAAVSGSNSQQAATAMYQLSQALSTGTVKLMDWNSVSNAGMGGKVFQESLKETARVAGVSVDEIIASAGSFRESLASGWLTSDVLTETLQKFTGDLSKAQLRAKGYNEEQIKGIIQMGKTAQNAATKVKTMSQLIGTLQEAAGSGWAKSWQLIFGDFNQAKKMWTKVNREIGGIIEHYADRRNRILESWNKKGGRDVAMEAIANAWKALLHLIQPIRRAFRDIFPRTTGKQLFSITEAIRDFTEHLILAGPQMRNIRNIFGAVFGVLGVGWEIIKGLVRWVGSLFGLFVGGTGGLLDFSGSIAEVVKRLTEWILKGDYIATFFDKIIAGRAAILKPIIAKFSEWLSVLADIVSSGVDVAIDGISAAFRFLAPILEDVGNWLQKVGEYVRTNAISAFDALVPVLQDVWAWLQNVGDKIRTNVISALDALEPVIDRIRTAIANAFGSLSGIGGNIGGAFGGLAALFDIGSATDAAASGIEKVKDAFSNADNAASGAKTGLEAVGSWLKDFGGFLLDIAKGVGSAIAALGSALYEEVAGLFRGGAEYGGAIAGFFGNILSAIGDAVSGLSFGEIIVILNTLFTTGIMASLMRFMFQFGGVFKDMRGILQGIGGPNGVLATATDSLKSMQSQVKYNNLLKIAGALAILAAALWVLSTIDPQDLANSLAALGAMLLVLVVAMKTLESSMPDEKQLQNAVQLGGLAVALMALGAALLLMAGAVYILGKMDRDELEQGIVAIAAVLGGIVAATAILNKAGGTTSIIGAAIAIGILAFALTALAGTIQLYNQIDMSTIAEGGGKIALVILAIGGAMRAFPEKGALAAAASMAVMSVALTIIAKSLQMMAKLTAGDSAQSIITMGIALGILAAAAYAMEAAMPGAQAMVVMAAALIVIAKAMQMLGALDWKDSLQSLALLTGVFLLIIGLAALATVFAPAVLALQAFAVAVLTLGAGMALAGVGMLMFAMGLTMLAALGSAAMVILIDSINTFLDAIPGFVQRIGTGLLEAAKQIARTGPAFMSAIGVVLRSFLREVIKTIPLVGKVFRALIAEALRTLRAAVPDMIKTGFAILMALLRGLRKNIADITNLAVDIVLRFIRGIEKRMSDIVEAGVDLIVKFVKAMAQEIWSRATWLWEQAKMLGTAIWQGIKAGINEGIQAVKDAAIGLAADALSAGMSALGVNSPSKVFRDKVGRAIPEGMALGINANSKQVNDAVASMAKGALDSTKDSMSKMRDAISGEIEMDPTVRPVLDLTKVRDEAGKIGAMLSANPIDAGVSYQQASSISAQQQEMAEAAAESAATAEATQIKFEQNNYSPKALSHVEIYRQTRNQFSLAKEALKV